MIGLALGVLLIVIGAFGCLAVTANIWTEGWIGRSRRTRAALLLLTACSLIVGAGGANILSWSL